MSRLAGMFRSCSEQQRRVLGTFITSGDPLPESTVPAMHALVAGGADFLELGVPFSDPEGEGPAIQRSSERAISNGVTLDDVLEFVGEFRKKDRHTPVVLMGYLNSFLVAGYESFACQAAAVGVDGLIVVNLPPENARELQFELRRNEIDLIFLVAPTTSSERCKYIVEQASGFVYFVALKGITGADHFKPDAVRSQIVQVQRLSNIPVVMGFGIKTPQAARDASSIADGIAVGSAIVETMNTELPTEHLCDALQRQVSALRLAMDE